MFRDMTHKKYQLEEYDYGDYGDEFFTLSELAELLEVTRYKILEMIREEQMPYFKLGRNACFLEDLHWSNG